MVIYVDGKPIFVQNPKIETSIQNEAATATGAVVNAKLYRSRADSSLSHRNTNGGVSSNSTNSESLMLGQCGSKPVAKIPYLLAAAAAAATSNHKKLQQQHHQFPKGQYVNVPGTSRSTVAGSKSTKSSGSTSQQQTSEIKHDQEYMQLVSMFKQKNEKLSFNPLLNKSF
jgi:hypothetical protein